MTQRAWQPRTSEQAERAVWHTNEAYVFLRERKGDSLANASLPPSLSSPFALSSFPLASRPRCFFTLPLGTAAAMPQPLGNARRVRNRSGEIEIRRTFAGSVHAAVLHSLWRQWLSRRCNARGGYSRRYDFKDTRVGIAVLARCVFARIAWISIRSRS